jgi:hypothetical protein
MPTAGALTFPTPMYGSLDLKISGWTNGSQIARQWFTSGSGALTGTANQIRIIVDGTSGTGGTISSSTGNGTTEQKVTISGVTTSQNNVYSFAFDGTTVDFYLNGVLKNSHATNVPSTAARQTIAATEVKGTNGGSDYLGCDISFFHLLLKALWS